MDKINLKYNVAEILYSQLNKFEKEIQISQGESFIRFPRYCIKLIMLGELLIKYYPLIYDDELILNNDFLRNELGQYEFISKREIRKKKHFVKINKTKLKQYVWKENKERLRL